jgi:hypothetical protein
MSQYEVNQIWVSQNEWKEPSRATCSGTRPLGKDLEDVRRVMLTIAECAMRNDREREDQNGGGSNDMSSSTSTKDNLMSLFQCAMSSVCCKERFEVLQFLFEQTKLDPDAALDCLEHYALKLQTLPLGALSQPFRAMASSSEASAPTKDGGKTSEEVG